MFEYDFCYDDILSSSVVIKDGILFDDERFSFESYWENGFNHYERLFYSTGNGEKAPFPEYSMSCILMGGYPDTVFIKTAIKRDKMLIIMITVFYLNILILTDSTQMY